MNKIEYLKIRRILENYFKSGKYIDDKFIYEIIEIVAKSRKFNSMIDNVNIFNQCQKEGISGSYSPIEKEINIILPDKNIELFDYNTTVLHILLHELEHVGQHKKCIESKKDTFETGLLSTCFAANNYNETIKKRLQNNDIEKYEYFSVIEKLKFYEMYSKIIEKCYELLPSERQAEINSFSYMIELLKNIENKDKLENIKLNYLIRKLMGYKKQDDKVLSPTYELYRIILDFIKQPELLEKYYERFDSVSENMGLEERLYYGLNISCDEYDKQQTEIAKLLIK